MVKQISTTFCDDENGCQTSIPQGSVVRTTATTTATTTTIIGDNNGSGKSKSGELSSTGSVTTNTATPGGSHQLKYLRIQGTSVHHL